MLELSSILKTTFDTINFTIIFEIFILAILLYKSYWAIQNTRANQLIKGITLIILMLPLSYVLKLNMIYFILNKSLAFGIYFIIIIFQPEIRKALEQLGNNTFEENNYSKDFVANKKIVDNLIIAITNLSSNKIGALIVLQKKIGLKEIINTGVIINSDISSDLIENIFIPNTPLHDGATIINKNKILASGCFLPLSQNYNLNKNLGTRHRAALGLSEISDSTVIVISEETGSISLCCNSNLNYNISLNEMQNTLNILYNLSNITEKGGNFFSWKKYLKRRK